MKLKSRKVFLFFLVGSVVTLGLLLFVKGSLKVLDQRLLYFSEDAISFLSQLGDFEREQYILVNKLDFLFIFFYGGFLGLAYTLFFKDKEQRNVFILFPILLVILDLLETGIIFLCLRNLPDLNLNWILSLVFLTPTKWFFAFATMFILLNGYIGKILLKKYFN